MIRNIRITALTPVHIGSGRKYPMNIEAIHDPIRERVGVLSPEKVLDMIGAGNLEKWIAAIHQEENIWDFLKRFGVKKLEDVCSRTLVVYGSNISEKKDLKEQLLSARGNPLLPGSSIKGAIRTAILSYLLQNDHSIAVETLSQYRRRLHPSRWVARDYQKISSSINNRYFNGTDSPNANKDILRFLQVTDAEFPFETISTNVKILNLERSGWTFKGRGDQLTEAIGTDSETEIRMKINHELLEKNLEHRTISKKLDISFLKSFQELFRIINEHTNHLMKREIELWDEEMKQATQHVRKPLESYLEGLKRIQNDLQKTDHAHHAILRIGGDTGWDFITGAWIKNNTELLTDQEWENLYKQLNKGRNVDIFPKTRKLDEDGDFFGFVKLEII